MTDDNDSEDASAACNGIDCKQHDMGSAPNVGGGDALQESGGRAARDVALLRHFLGDFSLRCAEVGHEQAVMADFEYAIIGRPDGCASAAH